jgi:hypothetical protein
MKTKDWNSDPDIHVMLRFRKPSKGYCSNVSSLYCSGPSFYNGHGGHNIYDIAEQMFRNNTHP